VETETNEIFIIMKKIECLKFCKEARIHGYITHEMLLDLYKEDEEIPDEFIKLIVYKPKQYSPVIMTGIEGFEYFKSIGLI
jgi:hypothetical protein